ncbi:MAG: hypothetical protein LH702_23205 [Phormidesmis sp. CAN_BIN44]|nr:hypothetical protein [Phormidesmis sp. CAN_BIN44]
MRRAARVDANQSEIIKAFREVGCSVFPLHTVGRGFPDLAVGCRGLNLLVEIKNGSKCPSAQKLTPDEARFFQDWRGQVATVACSQDAIEMVQSVFSNCP